MRTFIDALLETRILSPTGNNGRADGRRFVTLCSYFGAPRMYVYVKSLFDKGNYDISFVCVLTKGVQNDKFSSVSR